MTLQNRVTPFNEIVADPARGLFMGNRGSLHNAQGSIVRWRNSRRWIICRTQFKSRRRELMAPGLYTELFFFDEPVALAAGHRPCAECRKDDYDAFRRAIQPRGEPLLSAIELDMRLDDERRLGNAQRRHVVPGADVPDGAMVAIGETAFLVDDRALVEWSSFAYGARRPMPDGPVAMLTPPLSAMALRRGYGAQRRHGH
jgi:hypothetical protein